MTSASARRQAIVESLTDSSVVIRQLAQSADLLDRAAQLIVKSFRRKGKLVSFGNGGSAADAQHLAAELAGRFEKERPGLPAVALTTNASTLTAIANDYDYVRVFSRQVENFVRRDDVAVAISTSGNSPNVLEGARAAKAAGAAVIAWTGQGGGKLKDIADVCLEVPSRRTSRIQEGHLAILHTLCYLVDEALFPSSRLAAGKVLK
jgi:D-sedoheptulose 7-phosphate isomerase